MSEVPLQAFTMMLESEVWTEEALVDGQPRVGRLACFLKKCWPVQLSGDAHRGASRIRTHIAQSAARRTPRRPR